MHPEIKQEANAFLSFCSATASYGDANGDSLASDRRCFRWSPAACWPDAPPGCDS